MPDEQANAVPAEAAETLIPVSQTAREAGTQAGATNLSAGTPTDQTLNPTAPTSEAAAPGNIDGVLADIGSVADFHRFMQGLPPASTLPAPEAVAQLAGEEATATPEDIAQLEQGAPLPKRLRIASLPDDRQRIILALTDTSKPLEEVLRSFAAAPAPEDPAASSAITAPDGAAPAESAATATPSAEAAAAATLPSFEPATLVPPKESSAALRSQLSSLRKQRTEALRSADMESAGDIDERIGGIEDRLHQVEREESAYDQSCAAVWDAATSAAIAAYPAAAREDSALAKEMVRLDQTLVRTRHPMSDDPNKPFFLAALAAARLGIAPRAGKAAAPPAAAPLKPAPMSVPTPRAAAPASQPPAPAPGGARTQAPSSAAAQVQVDQALASVKNTSDFLRLIDGL